MDRNSITLTLLACLAVTSNTAFAADTGYAISKTTVGQGASYIGIKEFKGAQWQKECEQFHAGVGLGSAMTQTPTDEKRCVETLPAEFKNVLKPAALPGAYLIIYKDSPFDAQIINVNTPPPNPEEICEKIRASGAKCFAPEKKPVEKK